MKPGGAYLLAFFAIAIGGSFPLALTTCLAKTHRVRTACIVFIGILWASPFFMICLKIILEGTRFDFGPPTLRHGRSDGFVAVQCAFMCCGLIYSAIRFARQDRLDRRKEGREQPSPTQPKR